MDRRKFLKQSSATVALASIPSKLFAAPAVIRQPDVVIQNRTLVGQRLFQIRKPGHKLMVKNVRLINCYYQAAPGDKVSFSHPEEIFDPRSTGLQVIGTHIPTNVIFPDQDPSKIISPDGLWAEGRLDPEYYPDALYPAEISVKEHWGYKDGVWDDPKTGVNYSHWRSYHDDPRFKANFEEHFGRIPGNTMTMEELAKKYVWSTMRSMVNLEPSAVGVWLKTYIKEQNFYAAEAKAEGRPIWRTRFRTPVDDMFLRHREWENIESVSLGPKGLITKKARHENIYTSRIDLKTAKDIASGKLDPTEVKLSSNFVNVSPRTPHQDPDNPQLHRLASIEGRLVAKEIV